MGDGGGESKRGEGGQLAGNSHREGYCEEGSFLECLRGYSENLDICFLGYFSYSPEKPVH